MQVKYAGKKFEILSTSDVRYQGVMYSADPSEQSIAFKNVFCHGTEDRRTGDQKVEKSSCTYEYIVFRACSLRELWLLEGNGRRLDVTDEMLIPLRAGKGASLANGGALTSGAVDEAPKRKVGYQSRSQQQQRQQGYEQYYQGGPPQGQHPGYNRRRANTVGGGGYGPPPAAPYDAPREYAPPPRDAYYGHGPPAAQGYYDQGYYGYGRRQGGGGGAYRQQRQAYYDGYRQRERAPQYYNQGGSGYYQQQGYRQSGQGGGYRDARQYNRDGRYQQRQYGNGYRQQQQGYGQGRRNSAPYGNSAVSKGRGTGNGLVGTGAYLDTRRLRGDEIDIKDQQDFDFGAAKDEFDGEKEKDMAGLVSAVDSMALEADLGAGQKEEDNKETETEEVEKAEVGDAGKEEESGKEHYDASKSFFDGLETETKRSKPRQDMQTQKDVDTSTFGSVAQSYKSRHINRPNQRGGNRGYGRQRQGNYNGYAQQGQGYGGGQQRRGYGQQQGGDGYGRARRVSGGQERGQERSNRWVAK